MFIYDNTSPISTNMQEAKDCLREIKITQEMINYQLLLETAKLTQREKNLMFIEANFTLCYQLSMDLGYYSSTKLSIMDETIMTQFFISLKQEGLLDSFFNKICLKN